jgi:hypothetical protein
VRRLYPSHALHPWRTLTRLPTIGSLTRLPTIGSLTRLPTIGSLTRLPTIGSLTRLPTIGSLTRLPTVNWQLASTATRHTYSRKVKVRSKRGPKTGPKSSSRTKKSRKTSKFQKERSRKRGLKWTSKTEPNSTENIQSNFPPKSTKNPVNSCSKCPRSLITSLNFICLRKFPPCERSEHPVPP